MCRTTGKGATIKAEDYSCLGPQMTMAEVHGCVMGLLSELDRFCRAQGIRYFLTGGALLGALRDGHLVPWDEDADVLMPREDYERFLREFPCSGVYRLLKPCPETKGSPWPFSKLYDSRTVCIERRFLHPRECGVFVDLFPVDGFYGDGRDERRFNRKTNLVNNVRRGYALECRTGFRPAWKNAVLRVLGLLIRLKSAEYYARKIDACAQEVPFGSTEWAGSVVGVRSLEQERLSIAQFQTCSEVELEGVRFTTFADPVAFAKGFYGDDWEQPKKTERDDKFKHFWRL